MIAGSRRTSAAEHARSNECRGLHRLLNMVPMMGFFGTNDQSLLSLLASGYASSILDQQLRIFSVARL